MQLSAPQPKDPTFLIASVLPSAKLFTHRLTKATPSCSNPSTSRTIRTWSLWLLKLLSNARDDAKRGGRTVQAEYRQHEYRPKPQQMVLQVLAAVVPSILPAPHVPAIPYTGLALFLSQFSGEVLEEMGLGSKARTADISREGQRQLPEE